MALRLNVKLLTGELHSLTVAPNKTVWDLKVLAEEKTGCSRYLQKLAGPRGGGAPDLKDEAELSDCGLRSGDTLCLIVRSREEPLTLFLKNDRGRTSAYQVLPSDTVSQFKARVQRQEGVRTEQFWLLHEGKTMEEEGGRTLSDYKVAPGDTVYLNLRLRGG